MNTRSTFEIMKTANPALQEKRRQEILEAAIHCFIQQGFHQTGMREIAEHAGVSLGTLYRYFSNKEAIIFAIAEQESQDLQELLEALAVNDNIVESFVEIIPYVLKESARMDYATLGVEIVAEAARNDKLAAIFRKQDKYVRQALTELIQNGIEHHFIDDSLPAEHVAEILIALHDGLNDRILFSPEFDPEVIQPTFEQLIRRFLTPRLRNL